jgi:hypothetical protein
MNRNSELSDLKSQKKTNSNHRNNNVKLEKKIRIETWMFGPTTRNWKQKSELELGRWDVEVKSGKKYDITWIKKIK